MNNQGISNQTTEFSLRRQHCQVRSIHFASRISLSDFMTALIASTCVSGLTLDWHATSQGGNVDKDPY